MSASYIGLACMHAARCYCLSVGVQNAHFNGSEVNGFTHVWTRRQEALASPGLYHNHGAYLSGGDKGAYMDPPLQTHDANLRDFVSRDGRQYYFYGGFYGASYCVGTTCICSCNSVMRAGGSRTRFCASEKLLVEWCTEDVSKGHHSPVDDETYINAINYRFPPTRVLTTAYMHPDRPNAPVSTHIHMVSSTNLHDT
jgi:hypothetical protein